MVDIAPTVDHDFLELMPHVITFERCTGVDTYGQRQYDAPLSIQARVEGRMRKVVGQDGMETMSSIQIYLSASPGLKPDDRITLPAGFNPPQPNIIGIERQPDSRGAFYEAIYS